MKIAWELVCGRFSLCLTTVHVGQLQWVAGPSWGRTGNGLLVTSTLDLAVVSRLPRLGTNEFYDQFCSLSPFIP